MKASTLLVGAGSFVSALGELQSAHAERFQSGLNARAAEDNAKLAIMQSIADERKFRVQFAKLQGENRALYAASGIDVNEGSPLDILEESARAMEFDAQSIRREGELKSHSYKMEALQWQLRGIQAGRAGLFGVASSLLRGASQLGSYNNDYQPRLKRTA